MLRAHSDYSHAPKTESPVQAARKSREKDRRDNGKPCIRREHNHTTPEFVWGDEGPVNEPRETS